MVRMKRSGFAVGLGSAGAGAEMADLQGAAGDGVDGGAVGRAIVGEHSLHGDAVAREERGRAAEEGDRGGGLLVCKDFGVGQAGAVIDRDVDVVPACRAADVAGSVGKAAAVVRASAPDPLAGAALDPSELLDVDVDEFARLLALITLGRLEAQPSELAHPDPGQDARDRRERPAKQLGDLGAREPDAAQGGDHGDRPLISAIGHRLGR
jgi:hypothetical protein